MLRPKAKAAMMAGGEARSGVAVLRTIPFLGPVRVALLLATHADAVALSDQAPAVGLCRAGRGDAGDARSTDWRTAAPVRRRRAPMTRGLNRNHNPHRSRRCSRVRRRPPRHKPGPCRTCIRICSSAACARNSRA